MGWKGTVRSMNAAAKRAEKHNAKVQKEVMKEYARQEVEGHEDKFEELTSYHLRVSKEIDWSFHKNRAEPVISQNHHLLTNQAQNKFDNYIPNFFIKLLHLENWRKNQLEENLERAIILDEISYNKVREEFLDEYNSWKSHKEMAERIYAKDIGAYEEVVNKNETFMFLKRVGTTARLEFIDGVFDIEVEVRNETVIPKYSKKLMANGSISEKEIPTTKFNSLYQDHVCSIVLRVAREVMATFPIDTCTISAKATMLNSSTGHLEDQIILTAFIPKHTIKAINFSMIDPSDAFKNFKHRMSYKSNGGLAPVEKMKAKEVLAA